jgi:hypothetical protein
MRPATSVPFLATGRTLAQQRVHAGLPALAQPPVGFQHVRSKPKHLAQLIIRFHRPSIRGFIEVVANPHICYLNTS